MKGGVSHSASQLHLITHTRTAPEGHVRGVLPAPDAPAAARLRELLDDVAQGQQALVDVVPYFMAKEVVSACRGGRGSQTI